MTLLHYADRSVEVLPGESALDAFLRGGIVVPFSCRAGVCHVCLSRCIGGEVPAAAQNGLAPHLRERGYVLLCRLRPEQETRLVPPDLSDLGMRAYVVDKTELAPDVIGMRLEPERELRWRPGQFVNLRRHDGVTRSYSIASRPDDCEGIELHVRRSPNGQLSPWLCDELEVGDTVFLQQPAGTAVYDGADPAQPMLLVAGGTGLAPLLGITREALARDHRGPLRLYHGSRDRAGLYQHGLLLDLASRHEQLRYAGCVDGPADGPGIESGDAVDLAFDENHRLDGWRVHVAGPPEFVARARDRAIRQGARPEDVVLDPFATRDLRRPSSGGPAPQSASGPRRRDEDFTDLWSALLDGERLMRILVDFYSRVYEDPRLSPYFVKVTRQRIIEKQYSFMRQLITGDKVYFGDRPRNAHHWMVISDELFDYRLDLMRDCMRAQGLPERFVAEWHALERDFRDEIVKSHPEGRRIGEIELPVGGFAVATVDSGTLCDACGGEVAPGTRVRYHQRLGTTYCLDCSPLSPEETATS